MTEIPYGTIGHWKEPEGRADVTTFGSAVSRYMVSRGREVTVMAVDRGRVMIIKSDHPAFRPGDVIDATGNPPWDWE
jgi:hypothetical protein